MAESHLCTLCTSQHQKTPPAQVASDATASGSEVFVLADSRKTTTSLLLQLHYQDLWVLLSLNCPTLLTALQTVSQHLFHLITRQAPNSSTNTHSSNHLQTPFQILHLPYLPPHFHGLRHNHPDNLVTFHSQSLHPELIASSSLPQTWAGLSASQTTGTP